LVEADSVDTFTATLEVLASGVWVIAPRRGFERQSIGWMVLGRQGMASPAAIVGTDARAVAVEGGPASEEVVNRLLATLRFLP
jgi:hypothetical protein